MIVKSMVDPGHCLPMKVVAGGIETAQAVDTLAALPCDIGQGCHPCRPPLAEALMQRGTACTQWGLGHSKPP